MRYYSSVDPGATGTTRIRTASHELSTCYPTAYESPLAGLDESRWNRQRIAADGFRTAGRFASIGANDRPIDDRGFDQIDNQGLAHDPRPDDLFAIGLDDRQFAGLDDLLHLNVGTARVEGLDDIVAQAHGLGIEDQGLVNMLLTVDIQQEDRGAEAGDVRQEDRPVTPPTTATPSSGATINVGTYYSAPAASGTNTSTSSSNSGRGSDSSTASHSGSSSTSTSTGTHSGGHDDTSGHH